MITQIYRLQIQIEWAKDFYWSFLTKEHDDKVDFVSAFFIHRKSYPRMWGVIFGPILLQLVWISDAFINGTGKYASEIPESTTTEYDSYGLPNQLESAKEEISKWRGACEQAFGIMTADPEFTLMNIAAELKELRGKQLDDSKTDTQH